MGLRTLHSLKVSNTRALFLKPFKADESLFLKLFGGVVLLSLISGKLIIYLLVSFV